MVPTAIRDNLVLKTPQSAAVIFIDEEVQVDSGAVVDYGATKTNGLSYHGKCQQEFKSFLADAGFLCGHNLINHDSHFMKDVLADLRLPDDRLVDTLFLSPLLFPRKPYHSLLKDEKLISEEPNNPLNDAIKAKDLFFDEVASFQKLPEPMKTIYFLLLHNRPGFAGFFNWLGYQAEGDVVSLIGAGFQSDLCGHADLAGFCSSHPVELAYCLANISTRDRFSMLPAWVAKTYPDAQNIMYHLRGKPCLEGCPYCRQAFDAHRGLKRHFGYDTFRTFDGEPLQEMAVRTALEGKSLLAVFPTGGGKSIAFQVPALVEAESTHALTVVISPLQSLMKDQVDNLDRAGIHEAVTINGLIDPIERANAMQRVLDGSASILYISPESLRSRSIEELILNRQIARFVIDEAHCFSAWGQDFRVDYLYIGRFLKRIQEEKNLAAPIPVSCFTATAKPSVISDILGYFNKTTGLVFDPVGRRQVRAAAHVDFFTRSGHRVCF